MAEENLITQEQEVVEVRDLQNYFPKFFKTFSRRSREVVNVGEILSSLRFTQSEACFAFDGYEKKEEFNQGKEPDADYHFVFTSPATEILALLQDNVLDYMTTEAKSRWKLDTFLIDMQIKFVLIQLRDENGGRVLIKEINTAEKFDELVATNPELVGAIQIYCWSRGQEISKELAAFK